MAEAALAVAIVSVLVAGGSLAVAIWQGRVNARAIKAEERDRREQLGLLRQQVETEAEERQREQQARARARVVVTAGGWQALPDRFEQEFLAIRRCWPARDARRRNATAVVAGATQEARGVLTVCKRTC
jgi:hypothetical protein